MTKLPDTDCLDCIGERQNYGAANCPAHYRPEVGKVFRVLITETLVSNLDIIAEDADEARDLAWSAITVGGITPWNEETQGFDTDDVIELTGTEASEAYPGALDRREIENS